VNVNSGRVNDTPRFVKEVEISTLYAEICALYFFH
jgi:hypothetical protein